MLNTEKKSLKQDLKVSANCVNFDESNILQTIVSNLRTNGLSDTSDSQTKATKYPPKSKLIDTIIKKATNVYNQSNNIIDIDLKVNHKEI